MNRDLGEGIKAKVTDLVAVTQRLDIPRTLLLRRMTLSDPQSLKWASPQQLELIFGVILGKALERLTPEDMLAAQDQQFNSLLPDGPVEQREAERRVLFDLAQPLLAGSAPTSSETTEAVLDELQAQEEDEAPDSYDDFATLFDDSITRHVRRTLGALAATSSRPYIPLPFYLAPAFANAYVQVLREMLLPPMRASRRLRELARSRNWTETGAGGRIIGMVQSGDTNNMILHYWDNRWRAFHPDHVFKGKDGKPRPRRPIDDPWPLFKEEAAIFRPGLGTFPCCNVSCAWTARC